MILLVWTAVNSVAIAMLGAALILMVRQTGLVLRQIGPVGAKGLTQGPRIGEDVSRHLGGLYTAGRPVLVIFGSRTCPVCEVVQEATRHIAPHWKKRSDVVMLFEQPDRGGKTLEEECGENFRVTIAPEMRQRCEIRSLPYAVMVDRDGYVLGTGLVNTGSHVESLLELLDKGRAAIERELDRVEEEDRQPERSDEVASRS